MQTFISDAPLVCILFDVVDRTILLYFPLFFFSFYTFVFFLFFEIAPVSQFLHVPLSGELRTQKSKSHLVRTQSLNVLPLKPGVGQYIVMHATLTARDFFLLISTLPVHSSAFFPKPLPIFFCVGSG